MSLSRYYQVEKRAFELYDKALDIALVCVMPDQNDEVRRLARSRAKPLASKAIKAAKRAGLHLRHNNVQPGQSFTDFTICVTGIANQCGQSWQTVADSYLDRAEVIIKQGKADRDKAWLCLDDRDKAILTPVPQPK